MSFDQALALSDSQAIMKAFADAEPKLKAAELIAFKKEDPQGFASLAEDCRAYLIDEE